MLHISSFTIINTTYSIQAHVPLEPNSADLGSPVSRRTERQTTTQAVNECEISSCCLRQITGGVGDYVMRVVTKACLCLRHILHSAMLVLTAMCAANDNYVVESTKYEYKYCIAIYIHWTLIGKPSYYACLQSVFCLTQALWWSNDFKFSLLQSGKTMEFTFCCCCCCFSDIYIFLIEIISNCLIQGRLVDDWLAPHPSVLTSWFWIWGLQFRVNPASRPKTARMCSSTRANQVRLSESDRNDWMFVSFLFLDSENHLIYLQSAVAIGMNQKAASWIKTISDFFEKCVFWFCRMNCDRTIPQSPAHNGPHSRKRLKWTISKITVHMWRRRTGAGGSNLSKSSNEC